MYSSHAVRPAYPAEQSTPDALGSVCAVKQNVPRAKLSSLALTDELTGLYNRLGFLYLTERQLKRVRRSARDILLFFIDVDGLKSINDSFGHSEGDSALIHTAEILINTFRDSDILARLGRDEFAALVMEASGHNEATITARLRESLETVNAQEPRYALSLNVGVARVIPRTASSIAELMLQADRAIYQAKTTERKSSSPDAFFARPTSETKQASSWESTQRRAGVEEERF